MAGKDLIVGDDGPNALQGTPGDDLIYGFDPNSSTSTLSSISAHRILSGGGQAIFATSAPGDSHHLFVVYRGGTIRAIDLATGAVSQFIDLSSQITTQGEGGLLGLAFDPGYAQNGLFYVDLTNPSDDTEIRRYQVSADNPLQADPASALPIISIDQPAGRDNHKAGWLGFGPDGYLYATLGDGGGGGDPDGNGQNPQTLLGKLLRLDVHGDDFPADGQRNYAIPADNPFVGLAGTLPEIWALGLRNPFRVSFDRELGTFWVPDVGQDAWEEINIGQAGANYGWSAFEGPAGFRSQPLGPGTLTQPIYSYDHTVGHAIIGGYVYRGESDALQGQYFFSDVVDNKVFTLTQQGGAWVATERTSQIVPDAGTINNPTAFGEDAVGNLYLLDLDGDVFRLTPNAPSNDQSDTFTGGGGNDTIHGGAGNDTAIYSGPASNYSIAFEDSTTLSVTDNAPGSPDGSDTLYSVENLKFSDAMVAVSDHHLRQTNADGTLSATDFDPANQFSWASVSNSFDSSGRLLAQHGINDDGSTWLDAYDSQQRLDLTWYFDANGVTRSATDYDQASQFSFSSVTNGFDSSGRLTAQHGINDDGSTWLDAYDSQQRLDLTWYFDANGVTRSATDYDQTNQFGFSSYTNGFDSTGLLTAQHGINDDGSTWLNAYDSQERLDILWNFDANGVTRSATDFDQANQYSWSTVTNTYDASGHFAAQNGVFDDGTTWHV